MEFGPRALGGRSILGDARSPTMQKMLNLKVKYRESFRPFAPSVLREDVGEWFELDERQPVHAAGRRRAARAPHRDDAGAAGAVRHRQAQRAALDIPAVTHVDYSARIQTVHQRDQPALPRADQPRSRRSPAARSSSTPASTCAASRSSARPRTRSAASWAPRSRRSPSATASCARKTRTRARSRTTRPSSSWTDWAPRRAAASRRWRVGPGGSWNCNFAVAMRAVLIRAGSTAATQDQHCNSLFTSFFPLTRPVRDATISVCLGGPGTIL